AIAGGWGAIEGLLSDPGNRASAADNLAALVACSLPRAELTRLSYSAQSHGSRFAGEFENCSTNRERSELVARLILDGHLNDLKEVADRAAVLRTRKLLQHPSDELRAIRSAVADAF